MKKYISARPPDYKFIKDIPVQVEVKFTKYGLIDGVPASFGLILSLTT
jgi:hypothetical protein